MSATGGTVEFENDGGSGEVIPCVDRRDEVSAESHPSGRVGGGVLQDTTGVGSEAGDGGGGTSRH